MKRHTLAGLVLIVAVIAAVGVASTFVSSEPTAPAPVADTSVPEATISKPVVVVAAASVSQPAPSEVKTITFDDIKFEMADKEIPFDRKMLTEAIEALDGKRVRVRGFMLPTFQDSDIAQFVLMRDNKECCFGPGAWIYDSIVVDMTDGKTTNFEVRPISVEGRFKIEELVDPEGIVRSVYHIDAKAVE